MSGTVVEPGLVPHFEKLCTAKYNVVMSAGLILPEGRESDSVLQTATSLASEREREKEERGGQNKKEGTEEMRMIYVLLCRCRNKSSDLAQRGKQAIKHGINSELVPFFEKPQMS